MKKLIISLFMIVVFATNTYAKEVCVVNQNVKVCKDSKKDYLYETTYSYQDSTLKQLLKKEYKKFNKNDKLLYKSITTYQRIENKDYKKVVKKYYYNSNFKYVKNSYYPMNKIKTKYTKIKYRTYLIEEKIYYDKNSKLVLNKYEEKNLDNSLKKSILTNYKKDSNLKLNSLENHYDKNGKLYYNLSKKYNDKGKINYYYAINSADNKITTQNFYNQNGIKTTASIDTYDQNNSLVKNDSITYYANGIKKQIITINYNSNKNILGKTIENRKNNQQNNLISKYYYTYKNNKLVVRDIDYYDNYTNKYIGTRSTSYDNGKIVNDDKVIYYTDLKSEFSTTKYLYTDNILRNVTTTYYDYSGPRNKKVVKKYNSSKNLIYDFTTEYSIKTGYPKLETGYLYNSDTYSYNYAQYKTGKKVMQDKTIYKNNSITKLNYERIYYDSNGLPLNIDKYDYVNGKIDTSKLNPLKPVQSGVISSPSWFYPASYGGGWHPGIDIATYDISKYGKYQPIKLNFDKAIYLDRYNKAHSTNSWGLGNLGAGGGGLGNYVMIATEINGRFYTIIYAHQKKVSSDSLTKINKVEYLKGDTIGYVGSSGSSTGPHIHLQIHEHTYAKSLDDIKERFIKEKNNILFNVNYYSLGNYNDIFVVNPDVLFNLSYMNSWK